MTRFMCNESLHPPRRFHTGRLKTKGLRTDYRRQEASITSPHSEIRFGTIVAYQIILNMTMAEIIENDSQTHSGWAIETREDADEQNGGKRITVELK
jgi:hypothetical protein